MSQWASKDLIVLLRMQLMENTWILIFFSQISHKLRKSFILWILKYQRINSGSELFATNSKHKTFHHTTLETVNSQLNKFWIKTAFFFIQATADFNRHAILSTDYLKYFKHHDFLCFIIYVVKLMLFYFGNDNNFEPYLSWFIKIKV